MLCPTVLVYLTSWLTYRLGRIVLRKAGHIGLANLITGREVMPELIQDALTPDSLSDLLATYLTDPAAREKMLASLREVNALLGDGDAADRAARAVLEMV